METNEKNEAVAGEVDIFDEVIRSIVGAAAVGVEGVVAMRGGIIEGLKEAATGKRDYSKGVEVKRAEENACILDLFVIVEYNINIVEVAKRVQFVAKERVESLTGKKVKAVNVHVVDLKFQEAHTTEAEKS